MHAKIKKTGDTSTLWDNLSHANKKICFKLGEVFEASSANTPLLL